jgi:hypothetical protein
MSAQPPQTQPTLSLPQMIWRMTKAVVIWLLVNLVTFVLVSFVVFSLLSSQEKANPDEAFTLAVICAIPAALIVSSLVVGRKLIYLAWKRYRD